MPGANAMTCLEHTLASILDSIERARLTRDALTLAALLQRKDSICAALAAPEHSWSEPREQIAARIGGRDAGKIPLVA
jgi:hypothetical protein